MFARLLTFAGLPKAVVFDEVVCGVGVVVVGVGAAGKGV